MYVEGKMVAELDTKSSYHSNGIPTAVGQIARGRYPRIRHLVRLQVDIATVRRQLPSPLLSRCRALAPALAHVSNDNDNDVY